MSDKQVNTEMKCGCGYSCTLASEEQPPENYTVPCPDCGKAISLPVKKGTKTKGG